MPRRRSAQPWKPDQNALSRILEEQNPWQFGRPVPEAHPAQRPLAQALWRRLHGGAVDRFHVVLGARRVGKTTAMYQTVGHLLEAGVAPRRLWWLRLDHPLLTRIALGELIRPLLGRPTADLERPLYLFLDELTYGADWDLWLKTFFDERWDLRLVGTSSATAALRERRLESGIGRWEEHYLGPYLLHEFLSLVGQSRDIPIGPHLASTLLECESVPQAATGVDVWRKLFLFVGGFPELLSGISRAGGTGLPDQELMNAQRILRSEAVERAIYKDIPQAFQIDNPMALERLLYVLAAHVTGLLSPTSIGKDLGLSQPTFDRYLSYLEQAYLVFTLPNYSGTERQVQRRGRKLYFVDGAVRNAALQRGLGPLADSSEMGLLTENLVASELHALSRHAQVRLYHWRDGDREVDLVYDDPNGPLAIEIASSPEHPRSNLRAFMSRHRRFDNGCYLVAPGAPVISPGRSLDGIGSMPLDLFLLAVGGQAEAESIRTLAG